MSSSSVALSQFHILSNVKSNVLAWPSKTFPPPFPEICCPKRTKNDVFVLNEVKNGPKRPYNTPKRAKNVWEKAKNGVFGPKMPAF